MTITLGVVGNFKPFAIEMMKHLFTLLGTYTIANTTAIKFLRATAMQLIMARTRGKVTTRAATMMMSMCIMVVTAQVLGSRAAVD